MYYFKVDNTIQYNTNNTNNTIQYNTIHNTNNTIQYNNTIHIL
jgi:hypothetical protein